SGIEPRVICGSPQTVAEKLLAFRRAVGPFGHVLVTGMDWGGPNREWEQESMRRLAGGGVALGRGEGTAGSGGIALAAPRRRDHNGPATRPPAAGDRRHRPPGSARSR